MSKTSTMSKRYMSSVENKSLCILGLGSHGGGISCVLFAHRHKAKHIFISDKKNKDDLAASLKTINHVLQLPTTTLETSTHSLQKILQADVIIKNPAIIRTNELIQTLVKEKKHIETDISLFLKEIHDLPTDCYAITGTKGKSSISTALHKWNEMQNITSVLAGNITYSPLHFLLNENSKKNMPQICVLELSSFQIGDLNLVNDVPYNKITLGILTNILPDHQNYYTSMQKYIDDKLFLFQQMKENTHVVLPFAGMYEKTIKTSAKKYKSKILWHSTTFLPTQYVGAWCNKEGLFIRQNPEQKETKVCNIDILPPLVIKENIACFTAACMANNYKIPQTQTQWKDIFCVAHRKEFITEYKERLFYNDSAATIPQAMQLQCFLQDNNTLHIICGGTDKNLLAQDFISSCKQIVGKRLQLYLLTGSYTNKCLPYLQKEAINFEGPFSSLKNATDSAYKNSHTKDVIALCPGCASFEMFLHEFDRGNKFKEIVLQITKQKK